jgi:hypothetical protein
MRVINVDPLILHAFDDLNEDAKEKAIKVLEDEYCEKGIIFWRSQIVLMLGMMGERFSNDGTRFDITPGLPLEKFRHMPKVTLLATMRASSFNSFDHLRIISLACKITERQNEHEV